MLTPEGTVADGPGETIFVVQRGQALHARPLDGDPARDHARLGHPDRARPRLRRCVEKTLIRSDLYLADEVFMCGTAAEVTPVRSVDDHEIGVGDDHARDPEGVPRHRARRERPLGRSGASSCPARRARRVSTATRRIALSAPWIDERDEELVLEVLRSGRLSLGPTGPRFEAAARRGGRRAVLRGGLVRHRRACISACGSRASGRATR